MLLRQIRYLKLLRQIQVSLLIDQRPFRAALRASRVAGLAIFHKLQMITPTRVPNQIFSLASLLETLPRLVPMTLHTAMLTPILEVLIPEMLLHPSLIMVRPLTTIQALVMIPTAIRMNHLSS